MTFTITQGDNSPSMVTTLGSGTNPVDLTNVVNIRFIMQDEYERIIIDKGLQDPEGVNKLDEDRGEVEVIFTNEETSTAGTYKGEFEVEYQNGAIETFPTSDRKIIIEIVEQIA